MLKYRQISVLVSAFLFGLIVLAPLTNSTLAVSSITEPQLTLEGVETHDVYYLDNIFKVKTSTGDIELPYEYDSERNITIDVYYIEFAEQFINESVAKATQSDTALATASWSLLRDTKDIKYILCDIRNASTLANGDSYSSTLEFTLTTDVKSSDYLLFIAKVYDRSSDVTKINYEVRIYAIDEGGEDHYLFIRPGYYTTSVSVFDTVLDNDEHTDDVAIYINYDTLAEVCVIQIPLETFNDALNVNFVRWEKIAYTVGVSSNATQAESYAKVFIRVANIFNSKVMINNIVLNKTSTISINNEKISSTVDITKIANAQIPFKYRVEPEKSYDADNLAIKYDYLFKLETGDGAISYGTVTANFTVNDFKSPDANVSYFFINGADYTEQLESNGYYSWAVSPDTQYVVQAKFVCSEELFDVVIGRETPPGGIGVEVIYWYIGAFLAFIGGLVIYIHRRTGEAIQEKGKQLQRKAKAKSLSKK